MAIRGRRAGAHDFTLDLARAVRTCTSRCTTVLGAHSDTNRIFRPRALESTQIAADVERGIVLLNVLDRESTQIDKLECFWRNRTFRTPDIERYAAIARINASAAIERHQGLAGLGQRAPVARFGKTLRFTVRPERVVLPVIGNGATQTGSHLEGLGIEAIGAWAKLRQATANRQAFDHGCVARNAVGSVDAIRLAQLLASRFRNQGLPIGMSNAS